MKIDFKVETMRNSPKEFARMTRLMKHLSKGTDHFPNGYIHNARVVLSFDTNNSSQIHASLEIGGHHLTTASYVQDDQKEIREFPWLLKDTLSFSFMITTAQISTQIKERCVELVEEFTNDVKTWASNVEESLEPLKKPSRRSRAK